jgi:hypothetical protein
MTITVNTEYPINSGHAVVDPFVSLTKKGTVTATLLNSTGQVGTQTADVDGAAKVPVDVKNAVAGDYTLVVTTAGVPQQSYPIKLTGGGGGLPTWDPSKSYQTGDKVQWKGGSYSARWWTQNNEPGNPDTTGPDYSGKVWKDEGAASGK